MISEREQELIRLIMSLSEKLWIVSQHLGTLSEKKSERSK